MRTKAKAVTRQKQMGELLSLVHTRLPSLMTQLSKKINIDQLRAGSGTIGDLRIAKLIVGSANIGNLGLTGTTAKLRGAQAFMQNVRTVIQLSITFDWRIGIGPISRSGSENLGSISFPMSIGNVNVPSLANIDLTVPTASIPNVSANVPNINNLDLGAAQFTNFAARNTDAPAAGFTLGGMSLGAVTVTNIELPATQTTQATIDEFKPTQPLTLPAMELTNVQIPAARIPNIVSGAIGFDATTSSRCLDVNLGILSFKLCITPTLHLNADSLTIQDVDFSAAIGKMRLENIQLPLTVQGITLDNVGLQSIKIDKISI